MQEDLEKTNDTQAMSVEEMFLKSQESYEDAQLRAQEENRAFARTEFFRMDKFGVYRLRVLPIAPNAVEHLHALAMSSPYTSCCLSWRSPAMAARVPRCMLPLPVLPMRATA